MSPLFVMGLIAVVVLAWLLRKASWLLNLFVAVIFGGAVGIFSAEPNKVINAIIAALAFVLVSFVLQLRARRRH